MRKLESADKSNLIINRNDDNGKVSYTYLFNPDVQYRWENFASREMQNKKTGEKNKYKDLILMINPKDRSLYLFPTTRIEINEAIPIYKLNEWTFVDDSSLEDILDKSELERLKTDVGKLKDLVSIMAREILLTDIKEKQNIIRGVKKGMKDLGMDLRLVTDPEDDIREMDQNTFEVVRKW